jgi:hypothetical protein
LTGPAFNDRPLVRAVDAAAQLPVTTSSTGRPAHGACGASSATKPNISTTLSDCNRRTIVGFDLSTYATVEERLALFWAANPDGRIMSELVRMDDHACLFRAEVFRHRDDPHPTATGFAYEEKTERGVNATSHVENCETSAIGRALANWVYQAGKRPSREEMGKVERMGGTPAPSGDGPSDAQIKLLRALKYQGDPRALSRREASAEIDRLKTEHPF